MGTPYMRIDLLQRQVAYPDCPLVRLVEAQQQLDQGCLSASARPHYRRYFPFRDGQRNILQYIIADGSVIDEAHSFDTQGTVGGQVLHFHVQGLFFILFLMDLG